MPDTRHFLTLLDFSPAELQHIVQRAIEMKQEHRSGHDQRIFPGKVLGMIFAKSSTRTRVSFEAGMAQLGGTTIYLEREQTQLARNEPIADTSRVLSRYVDGVVLVIESERTTSQDLKKMMLRLKEANIIGTVLNKSRG